MVRLFLGGWNARASISAELLAVFTASFLASLILTRAPCNVLIATMGALFLAHLIVLVPLRRRYANIATVIRALYLK